MTSLALFDFDGTITDKDSLLDFLQFSFGTGKFVQAMLATSPFLISYKLGIYPNYRAKERLFTALVRDMPVNDFETLARDYAKNRLPALIRESALQKLRWHQSKGHTVVLVSASIDSWLKPWCEQMKIALLSSKLESENGLLTGRLAGLNCSGRRKAQLINQHYDLAEYDTIYAYGDSRGDREMLALADQQFYQYF